MATTEVEEGAGAAPAAPAAAAAVDEIKPYRIHVSLPILSPLIPVVPHHRRSYTVLVSYLVSCCG